MKAVVLILACAMLAGCSSTRIADPGPVCRDATAVTNQPPVVVLSLSGLFWRSAIVVGSCGTNDNKIDGGGRPSLTIPVSATP